MLTPPVPSLLPSLRCCCCSSEHTIDGVLFPLEVHLVTQTNVTGDLAVIGVMYKYGEENPLLEKIWPTESAGFPFRSRGMEGEAGRRRLPPAPGDRVAALRRRDGDSRDRDRSPRRLGRRSDR